jgi:hypothetical protein
MSDSARDDLVRKVAALLAKAASSDHEPERQAFEAKAQTLITRYQITQAELGTVGGATERTIIIDGWGNATRGVVFLWSGVAEVNQCATAHLVKRGWAKVVLIGEETNVAVTGHLVDHLLPQLRLALLNDRPRSRMSYAIGWSQQVVERLAHVQADAAAVVAREAGLDPGAGAALIPTNDAAVDALNEAYHVRRGRTTEVNVAEFGSGSEAGQHADLGQVRLDGEGNTPLLN